MSSANERYGPAISFLGTGDYRPATYTWNDTQCATRYFPVAVCQFWPVTELMVLATPQAQAKNGEDLAAELQRSGCRIPHRFVSIPECRNEDEMWELFDVLSDQLRQYHNQRIVLDVTHGYRSLPVLALMAAAYLRVAADITVSRIVYGAYDARQDDRVPVFDLTPFLALLEWTSATEQFLKTGNASSVAQLLKQAHDLPYRAGAYREAKPTELKKAAGALEELSQALHVLRPKHTLNGAVTLDDALRRAEPEVRPWAKPFGVLLDRIRATTQRFLSVRTDDPIREYLGVQQAMIDWYLEHERYVEAGLLMREFVVSLVAWWAGSDVFNQKERERIEEQLSAQCHERRRDRAVASVKTDTSLSVGDDIVGIWDRLTQLRNTLAHAKDDAGPQSVIARVQALAKKVRALPLPERGAGAAE
ncbi:MAG: TIGR02221 family CRISPR-associated protein [Chloroflexi bacterium]|nr:TIGR02221 family CRISPR-associated protein [Chloroflexota bacterium]